MLVLRASILELLSMSRSIRVYFLKYFWVQRHLLVIPLGLILVTEHMWVSAVKFCKLKMLMNLISAHLAQAFRCSQAKICPMYNKNGVILIYSKVVQFSFILNILALYYMQYFLLSLTLNFVRIYKVNPVVYVHTRVIQTFQNSC